MGQCWISSLNAPGKSSWSLCLKRWFRGPSKQSSDLNFLLMLLFRFSKLSDSNFTCKYLRLSSFSSTWKKKTLRDDILYVKKGTLFGFYEVNWSRGYIMFYYVTFIIIVTSSPSLSSWKGTFCHFSSVFHFFIILNITFYGYYRRCRKQFLVRDIFLHRILLFLLISINWKVYM